MWQYRHNHKHYRPRRYTRRPFSKFNKLLFIIFITWIFATIILYFIQNSIVIYVWYIIDALGAISGLWFGFRYYLFISKIYDVAKLFAMVFISSVLAFILGIFVVPYFQVTEFSFYPITYSFGYTMFAYSLAWFITTLELGIIFSILYSLYKLAHTIFVRF